jgi:hypothetical protein
VLIHHTTNTINSPSFLFYTLKKFGNIEVPILIDSGSGVTIIDEEIWKTVGIGKKLKKVPFALRT